MPRTLSLLAVLKKVDAKGVKSLSNAQWNTFLASDTEPNEIQDKIKKLEGYEEKYAVYDATGELIVEDNQAMIDRFKNKTGRAKGRQSFKVKKTKINVGDFLGKDRTPDKSQNPDISGIFNDDEEKKDDVGPKGMESKLGRLSRIVRDTRGRVLKLEQENKKKPNKKLATDGLDETVELIAEKVTSIEDTLKDQIKVDKENAKLQKLKLENEKRDGEESRLGKVTGFLKNTGDKIIAPVKSIFGQIFDFIKKLILGKILINILKWFGNPANQGKIDSVIKFLGNNWGKLLSLYLVFGTSLGRFIRFISKTLITGTIKLIALAARLAAAKKIKGARGVLRQVRGAKGGKLGSALNIIGTGAAVVSMGGMFQGLGGGDEEPQKFNKGGLVSEPQKFNKGGKVRGQGDKDTVPAMLTPGEFVMSKGAVQQYGIDTMESMNAAAGGTNVPVLMPNKKRKGFAGGGGPGSDDASSLGSYAIRRDLQGNTKKVSRVGEKTESELISADGSYTSKTVSDMTGGGLDETTTSTYNKTITNEDGTVTTFEEKKRMREQIVSIGIPDLIEHKEQLLSEIHKLEGYENVTIDQVLNQKTGIPQEKLLPILLRSDAQKATSDKEDKAHQEDLKARGIKPGQGYSMGYNDEVGRTLSGTTGYRLGQTNPPTLVSSSTSFTDQSKMTTKKPQKSSFSDLSDSINASAKDDGTRNEGQYLFGKTQGFNKGGLVPNLISNFNGGGLVSNSISNISNFNGGGLVQYLKTGGEVISTSDNATLKGGQVTSGNMNQSNAEKLKQELELQKNLRIQKSIHGRNSPQANEIQKQLLILQGTPAEAIYTDKKGNVRVKGYSTYSGKNQPSISNKSEKNPTNFSQPQGSGGGLMGGIKRAAGGFADYATLGMFDFDKQNRKGAPKDFGIKRIAGGLADWATMGLTDFDKRGAGIGQFNPIGGGEDKAWGAADEQAKRGEAQSGFGLKRGVGGVMDKMTGNMFDFDKQSGGGLLRKTANAIGGLFGKGDKVMGAESKIKEIKIPAEGLESILIKISSNQDVKSPVGQPSLSGPKITVLPESKSITTPTGEGAPDGGKIIPQFNVGHGSSRKMKQLGISR